MKDKYYLDIAKAIAARSSCVKHKYGAVIVSEQDDIVATGYNGAPRARVSCLDAGQCYSSVKELPEDAGAAIHGDQYGNCLSVHAEQNCMLVASRTEMKNGILYLACLTKPSAEVLPCNICNRMIANSGLAQVRTEAGVIWKKD